MHLVKVLYSIKRHVEGIGGREKVGAFQQPLGCYTIILESGLMVSYVPNPNELRYDGSFYVMAGYQLDGC